MKLMIASDIHGSEKFLSKLMERYNEEKADRLLLLGDLLYHGPRNDLPEGHNPKRCIEIYNAYKDNIINLKGNCDAEVDQMVLEFPVMSDIAYLYIDGVSIVASHGHIYNPSKLPSLKKGDYFLFGHTHVPYYEERDGITIMNPGSVSIPKEGSEHSYMTMEVIDGKACFKYKNLDGNEYKIV